MSPNPSLRRNWRRILLTLLAVVALVALYAWRALTPPAPLALPARGAVLADVSVVNPGADRAQHRTVKVEGERIASIEAAEAAGASPYAGYTVLPGLIDMHVHFPPPTGLGQTELFSFLYLMHGVTTVRDAGDVDGTATAPARDGVREGRFPGPRVYACGPFVDGPGSIWPNSRIVKDAAEARAAVAKIAADGFDCVKAYDRLAPDALAGLKEEAKQHGLPVIGHVPWAVAYVDARYDDVQHLTGIGAKVGDTRMFPARLDVTPTEAEIDEIVRRTVELGIANTPTLVTMERVRSTQDFDAARRAPGALLLPRLYRDAVWSREGSRLLASLTPADYALLDRASERSRRLVGKLHRAGAELHVGTDVLNPFIVPGESLWRELALFVESGLTPEEAWTSGTRTSGKFLGREKRPLLGTLAPGAPADLLVFREDPTRDLAALATLEAVVADGRLYTRADLDAQLARYRVYADGWLFDRISVAVTQRLLARIAAASPPPARAPGGN
jgi:imidazolonepropionase-like amidohydrolase